MPTPFDLNVGYGGGDGDVEHVGKKGRAYAHDVIRNLMADGLADGSSLITIRDYSNNIFAQVEHDGLEFYDGGEILFRSRKISRLDVDDHIVAGAGHVQICSNSRKVYKALSRAIDNKQIRFTGPFDCVNRYTLSGANLDCKVLADCPVPYFLQENSPLCGSVTFDQMLPDANGRRVVIVNVENEEPALNTFLQVGTIVYLGGDTHHNLSLLSSTNELSDGILSWRRKWPSELKPGACSSCFIVSSSP